MRDDDGIDLDDDDLYDDDAIDLHATRFVARVGVVSAKLRIKSNLDVTWFAIALEHERAALDARDRATAATEDLEMGAAFDDELHAAMVAIAAAAFAIDALYSKLHDMLAKSERPAFSEGANRPGRIVETLKHALELGKRGQAWQTTIPALFAQRDALVHFKGELQPAGMHPSGKAHVSLENVTYTAEETSNAVDLALEVLTTAYRSPRSKHRAIVDWSTNNAHVPPRLEEARAAVHMRR